MIPKIKQYLNTNNYFIFFKFFLHPSDSLGGSAEETLDNYQEYGDIKKLIVNQDFFPFLKECLEDEDFKDKLDYILLQKIKCIVSDMYNFKKKYIDDLEDEYLRNWCKNKVPLGPIYCKKYNQLELWGISEHYKQYGWLYELGVTKEYLDEIDEKLIKEIIDKITWEIIYYYEVYIEPIKKRKIILEIIRTDDYSKPESCFLESRKGQDKKSFTNLVCDNEFLEIAEKILLEQELINLIINNIISILEIGIDMKTLRVDKYENFDIRYNLLDKDKIKKFDLKSQRVNCSLRKEKIK